MSPVFPTWKGVKERDGLKLLRLYHLGAFSAWWWLSLEAGWWWCGRSAGWTL